MSDPRALDALISAHELRKFSEPGDLEQLFTRMRRDEDAALESRVGLVESYLQARDALDAELRLLADRIDARKPDVERYGAPAKRWLRCERLSWYSFCTLVVAAPVMVVSSIAGMTPLAYIAGAATVLGGVSQAAASMAAQELSMGAAQSYVDDLAHWIARGKNTIRHDYLADWLSQTQSAGATAIEELAPRYGKEPFVASLRQDLLLIERFAQEYPALEVPERKRPFYALGGTLGLAITRARCEHDLRHLRAGVNQTTRIHQDISLIRERSQRRYFMASEAPEPGSSTPPQTHYLN